MIAQLPRAERLEHGSGSTVVVGSVLLGPEEERPNESMGGTELMVKVSGKSVAGLVCRETWGRAWA